MKGVYNDNDNDNKKNARNNIINQKSPLIMKKRDIVVNMQTSDVGLTNAVLMLLFSCLFLLYYYYYLRTSLKIA